MNYKINISANGVELARKDPLTSRRLFFKWSAVAFLIAIVSGFFIFLLSGQANEEDFEMLFYILPLSLLGATGFFLLAFYVARKLKNMPERLVFNNDRGILEIYHEASFSKKIEIKYEQIASIRPRIIVSSHRNSSNVTRSSNRYAVTMYLHDGTCWDLLEDSILDFSYADEYCNMIKNSITLDKISDEYNLPVIKHPALSITQNFDKAKIEWRYDYHASSIGKIFFSVIFFIASYVLLMTFFYTMISEMYSETEPVSFTFENVLLIYEMNGPWIFIFIFFPSFFVGRILFVLFTQNFMHRSNKIFIDRNYLEIQSSGSKIPLSEIGTSVFTYKIDHAIEGIFILKSVPEDFSNIDFPKDLKSALKMIKNDIKTMFKSQSKEAKPHAKLSFYGFSPVDIYLVKEIVNTRLKKEVMLKEI
jgi:hypothetical protein